MQRCMSDVPLTPGRSAPDLGGPSSALPMRPLCCVRMERQIVGGSATCGGGAGRRVDVFVLTGTLINLFKSISIAFCDVPNTQGLQGLHGPNGGAMGSPRPTMCRVDGSERGRVMQGALRVAHR